MVPSTPALTPAALPVYVPVSLDGRLIGYIQSGAFLDFLRGREQELLLRPIVFPECPKTWN